jgi:hypothetical protein
VKRAFAQPSAESLAKAVTDGLKLVGALGGTVGMIKAAHARGPSPLTPDFLHKYPAQNLTKDATNVAIAKAQRTPRSIHPTATRTVDTAALNRMLERGRRLRKLGLPPQSTNANWTDAPLADDGATAAIRAAPAPSANTSQLGPRHAASITDGRVPAKVDDVTAQTLKAIFAAGPRRTL